MRFKKGVCQAEAKYVSQHAIQLLFHTIHSLLPSLSPPFGGVTPEGAFEYAQVQQRIRTHTYKVRERESV